jgi:hypothetical protein
MHVHTHGVGWRPAGHSDFGSLRWPAAQPAVTASALPHLLLGSWSEMSCTRVMKLLVRSCSPSSRSRVSASSRDRALRFLALSRISDRLS